MKPKKLYKTVIQVEVLSEEPINDNATLEQIYDGITYGPYSGHIETKQINSPIVGMDAVKECEKHGSDPDFFMMDYTGKEIEEG